MGEATEKLNHWRVTPSSYRMSSSHKPVVIYYDPTPGGKKNKDGTTSYSLNVPVLALTEWIQDPEGAAEQIVEALNETKLKKAIRALDLAIKIAEDARKEWDEAPSSMKAGKILIAMIDPSLRYRHDITEMHEIRAFLKKED
jgi:hypothetical protein